MIGWELEGKLTSLTGHLIACGQSNDDIIFYGVCSTNKGPIQMSYFITCMHVNAFDSQRMPFKTVRAFLIDASY